MPTGPQRNMEPHDPRNTPVSAREVVRRFSQGQWRVDYPGFMVRGNLGPQWTKGRTLIKGGGRPVSAGLRWGDDSLLQTQGNRFAQEGETIHAFNANNTHFASYTPHREEDG